VPFMLGMAASRSKPVQIRHLDLGDLLHLLLRNLADLVLVRLSLVDGIGHCLHHERLCRWATVFELLARTLGGVQCVGIILNSGRLFAFAPELELRTCSAEDLIVMKLFASRAIDVLDAEGVAIRNRGRVDWRYIEEQLQPLAEVKHDGAILERLSRLRQLWDLNYVHAHAAGVLFVRFG
jgi:hypothetical protein